MTDRTLAVHLEQFSKKEKLYLCWCLSFQNLGYDVHPGVLPFITADVALGAIEHSTARLAAQVRQKLKRLYDIGESMQFSMYLNHNKVFRRFGPNPERGHAIRLAPKRRVTVGVKWSLPHKDYIPDKDVLVTPHVKLEKDGGGCRWQITCDRRYYNVVAKYLMDYCM